MSDPLDDFLDRNFTCDGNDNLKNALRQRTTRVLRMRRWRQRLLIAGAAAACYLAGLGTVWLMPPRTIVTEIRVSGPPVLVQKIVEPEPVEEPLSERAIVYEWRAIDHPAERAASFLKAGDLYWEQEKDYASALRCYTQALNAGGAQALEFSPEDNYLLMALKNARRKEKGHVE